MVTAVAAVVALTAAVVAHGGGVSVVFVFVCVHVRARTTAAMEDSGDGGLGRHRAIATFS